MSDRNERLRAAVRDLSAELGPSSAIDPELRALLKQAVRDIETKLGDAGLSDEDSQGLSDRLAEVTQQFESEHPTLAGILERIVNALGQIGI